MRLIDADILRDEWLGAIGEYTANEILNSIDDIPTVPQEMSAREFAKQMLRSERWCIGKYCRECKYSELCRKVGENRTKEFTIPTAADAYVKLIKQWAAEHPEEANDER